MNQETNKGFTLIELLVVIAIIGILSSVVLASLTSAREKAIDAKILSEYRQIILAMEMYYNENGSYPQADPGNYCIGGTNCLLYGSSFPELITFSIDFDTFFAQNSVQTKNIAYAGTFDYVPSSDYTIGSGSNQVRGFIYQVPSSGNPKIIFGTNKLGVVETVVGIWTFGSSNSNSN